MAKRETLLFEKSVKIIVQLTNWNKRSHFLQLRKTTLTDLYTPENEVLLSVLWAFFPDFLKMIFQDLRFLSIVEKESEQFPIK